jgi:hypothetical protein
MTYLVQTDDKIRDATPEEITAIQLLATKENEKELQLAQRAVDKAELLERLGITADEAALLLS